MASKGYPEKYDIGFPISGISEESESIKVFHCGTKKIAGDILTNGGRVLCVTSLGENLENAFQSAYESTSKISWEGAFYRKGYWKKESLNLNLGFPSKPCQDYFPSSNFHRSKNYVFHVPCS